MHNRPDIYPNDLEFYRVVIVVVVVVVVVFIKLHLTAKPGPVILIFQCYRYGSTLWGIIKVVVVEVVVVVVVVVVVSRW